MSVSTQALVRDASTLANYKAWAKAISDFFATAGWLQASDTGQVVWTATVLTMTQVAVSGGSSVYSYSSFTGPTPRVGMSIIITGFATGGNNVTATLTAVSGGASGTVTVATTTQVNETHAGSGTTTAISTVPSNSLTRDYEIWQPGDALQTFYLKVQYGTGSASSNTAPMVRYTLSTATNGAGTQSGFVTSSYDMQFSAGTTVSSTSVQWQCHFSGDTGRMCILMWRDDTANAGGPCCVAIQRSLNASGTAYGTSTTGYVTMVGNSGNVNSPNFQQSLVFNVGVSNVIAQSSSGQNGLILLQNLGTAGARTGDVFNGSAPISPVFPDVGYFDNPMDAIMVGLKDDFTEGAQYSIASGNMPYGVSHNYIASKNIRFDRLFYQIAASSCLLLRYD